MKLIERKIIDKQKVKDLAITTELHPLIVKLLMMRDIDTVESINAHVKTNLSNLSSPYDLTNMDKARQMILNAIDKKQTIAVYGDYDCDGIGAIAILYLTLKHLKADVCYYIPQRHEEGYGLNIDAINKINSEYHPKLFITVDCGITSVKEVDYLKSLDIDVIITDHHEPANILPNTVIINPTLDGNINPLCGAGVALKIAEVLTDRDFVKQFMDICAVSTLADVVSLIGDNRIIVKTGLEMLTKRKCREGLKKLLQITGIDSEKKVSSADVAFRIAPRLNASGRLSSAYKSLNLLISDDLTEINLLCEELDRENKQRQDIFTEVLNEALSMLEEFDLSRNLIIVLKADDWEEGVIGIAAAKIVEQFNRPAILFTNKDGLLKGSARSINGINIYDVIKSCKDILLKFGGHAMAAGLSIKDEYFSEFVERTNKYIKENYDKDCFERKTVFDEKICIKDMNEELINSILELEPYGCSNPKPVFLCKEKKLNFYAIGKYPHIKARNGNCRMLAFNKKYAMPLLNSKTEKSVVYTIDKDIFKGREIIQCKIKDIYAEKAEIDDEILFAKYLENFTYKGATGDINKQIPSKKYRFGILYITFTNNTFNNFEHEGYARFIFNTNIMNPYNAIILSPEKEFVFTYYNRIVFLEKPPQSLIDYIKENFTGTVENKSEYPSFNVNYNLSIELLRKDYLFFINKMQKVDFIDIYDLYNRATASGYLRSFTEFCISYYIFNELELLTINNNGSIVLINKKVELNRSEIYNWLTKKEIDA